ncbi:hypothetical protein N7532_009009 [Penicillium argentinense]|uniref:Small secreted protein n=1 Tax=Penicillium argentinense TaxID=1131581 RepID=A0A9W9EYS7_9EURO|nr:uncharacterized protein N7532_009009 [Penicillium argentinense]KAJ5090325.1 hypothetical protein N7532_009009 [Penicillium argentinense]
MYATQTILATLLAASAVLAAPTLSASVTRSSDWSIQGLARECTEDNSSCTWTFGIFDGSETTDCTYIVNGPDASGGPTQCGAYTVTSNYVGDADPAWTQMSVVKDGLIIYPSYTDDVLANPPVADFVQAPQPTP